MWPHYLSNKYKLIFESMDKFAKDKDETTLFQGYYGNFKVYGPRVEYSVESLFDGFFLLNHSTQGSPKLRLKQGSPYL